MNQKEVALFLASIPEEVIRFKPTEDRVFIRRENKGEKKTKGGIIIPDNAQDKPNMGYVIAIGPDVFEAKDGFKNPAYFVGDEIMFGKYAGSEMTHMDNDIEYEYMTIRAGDIIGVATKASLEKARP